MPAGDYPLPPGGAVCLMPSTKRGLGKGKGKGAEVAKEGEEPALVTPDLVPSLIVHFDVT